MKRTAKDYTDKERAWLWINRVFGARVAAVTELLRLSGGPVELLDSVRRGDTLDFAGFIESGDRAKLISSASEASIDGYIASVEGLGAHAVTLDSPDYPDRLRFIYDPPCVLYVKGRLRRDTKLPFAIIGSRKCSHYGLEMARYFGRELSRYGACIISGLAVGCDAEAARGALEIEANEYPTIAVLGSGINVVYPESNRKLYDKVAEMGAVISEFLPGSKPTKYTFPQRNRIISGLSKGVLVVEAGENSGTSITVDFALDQGRDVFAVPGRINEPMSKGTNGLLKRGEAKPVYELDDILSEYGEDSMSSFAPPIKKADISGLGREQTMLYNALLTGEKNIDELCEYTGFSVSQLNIYLTEMELSGLIKQLSNKVYSI